MFFGGKGGVGKTTCAAATAIATAAASRRSREAAKAGVLIVSTDPAHSLGDVLGAKLVGTARRVAPRLDAIELDAPRAFARWLARHRAALAEILEHGTWLDPSDVDALLTLSIPGVDELAGFLEIAGLAERDRRGGYDLVVVDTAPTGHALRLLAAPDTVAAVAGVLDALQEEHRMVRDQIARVGGRPEAADRLIAWLAAQSADTAARLRDDSRTTFEWVMLAEELSLAETDDALGVLQRMRIPVPEIIVNNLLPDGGPCPVCDRRRSDQQRVLAAIRRRFGRGRRVRLVPAQRREPRGTPALASLGRAIADGSGRMAGPRRRPAGARQPVAFSRRPVRPGSPDPMRVFSGVSLLFVGGKGGVGKTTVSAAVALRLALETPSRRVLLLSTDPAHSLADVFVAKPSAAADGTIDGVTGAPPNLVVRELDAARAFAERRHDVESALDDVASSFGAADRQASGVSVRGPSAAASELIALAPPGVDELFGMLSVIDMRGDYDVIVVDTAPTGHALRLLEMPDAARDWTQMLLRILLKYKALVRPGRLAEELLAASKSIRALQEMLRDETRTRFIAVSRAAEVPRRETARLLSRLRRLRLAAPAVVANALTLAPGRCTRCRAVAAAEARELAALRRLCARRCAIIQTPLAAPAPRGAGALEEWSRWWVQA